MQSIDEIKQDLKTLEKRMTKIEQEQAEISQQYEELSQQQAELRSALKVLVFLSVRQKIKFYLFIKYLTDRYLI